MLSGSPRYGVNLTPTGEESDSGPNGRLLPRGPFGYDVFACTLFSPGLSLSCPSPYLPITKPLSQSAILFNSLLFFSAELLEIVMSRCWLVLGDQLINKFPTICQ